MSKMTYSKALALGMSEEMRRDGNVVFWGLDIAEYGGAFGASRGMVEEFGHDRVICMPISEAGYTGLAVGAAASGLRPIVELEFGDWVTIASDQLVNQAANMRYMFGGSLSVPMVMRLPCGAFGSAAAQHSHMFESWFAFIPGLKVLAPSTPAEAKGMIKAAIRDNNPVIFLEHRICYQMEGEVPEDPDFIVPIGSADIKRKGKDITIVTYSYMVHLALEAAEKLAKEGIDVEIVDVRSIKPWDEDMVLSSVKKTSKALVISETYKEFGASAEFASTIAEKAFDYLDAPVGRLGCLQAPIPCNPDLERYILPSVDKIIAKVKSMF